jgi:asparagine synthase (glutamine-hydrolysing)
MIDRLAHRGPDAVGVQEIGNGDSRLHLAHRRLSIIDLSVAADQPLVKDGLHLSYNGEIYNFRQLRTELENAGTRFLTNSDTEVLLEAWRAWGPGTLGRLRGMFAFALFDARTGSLVLARDPLGIKPLYVMPRGDGVLFASELKALVAAAGSELAVDARALVASTLFYFLPEEQTSLRGAYKLPPGSWSRWGTQGSTEPQRYWDPVETAVAAASGQPEPDLAGVLEESVTAHLVADVPVASLLSGGLDSSLVTAIAARRQPSIEAYTITFRQQDQRLEAMPDDAVYARKMAAHLGIRLHEIEISPDIVDLLPRMVDILDEPIGDPAAINTMLMCQAARETGVKVLLSGMGADEVFGGYRKHLACLLGVRYRRLPRTIRSGLVAPSVDALPVAVGGRGLRYTRWAKRFLTFASCRRRRPSGEATRSTTRGAGRCSGRGWPHVDAVIEGHRAVRGWTLADHQPDVPDRLPDLPAGAQPRLHRPGEHGRLDRGAGALRGPACLPGGVQHPWRSEDPRTYAEDRASPGRPGLGACRGDRSAEGILRCPAACLGDQRPRATDERCPDRRSAGGQRVPSGGAVAPHGR